MITTEEPMDASPDPAPQPPKPNGIRCPKCNSALSRVWRTRPTPNGVRRERVCHHCGKRYCTTEIVYGQRTA